MLYLQLIKTSFILSTASTVNVLSMCTIPPKSSSKVEWTGVPYSCLYASFIYLIQGWIFIHLRHWAALSKLHCAYNQKLGMPIHSTLLDDFGIPQSLWENYFYFALGWRDPWRGRKNEELFLGRHHFREPHLAPSLPHSRPGTDAIKLFWRIFDVGFKVVFGFAHEARQKVVVDRDKKLIGPHSRPGTDAIKLFLRR